MAERATATTGTGRFERGGVLPFVAVALGVIMVAAALAVDIGRMTDNNRNLQSVADLASIDSVRSLTGLPAAAQQSTIEVVALESASRNQHGTGSDGLQVELGFVDDAGAFTVAQPDQVPSAVRVTAIRPIDYLFISGGRSQDRSAVAAKASLVGLTVGSFAAAVEADTVPLLNNMLGTQLGGPVSLTLVGYQGLAAANVTLGELTAAAGLGSVQQLLAADLTADQFFTILVNALNARGDSEALAAVGSVEALRLANTTTATMRLSDLITVAAGTGSELADVDLGVGDLVRGTASAVDGNNLVAVNLGAAVPGLVNGTIKATAIEAPQTVIGGAGSTVSTSQVRLYLDLQLANVLGSPVHVPLAIDVAPATATVLDISCDPDGSGTEVTSQVDTSLALARIGELTDAELLSGTPPAPATILDVPLVATVVADSYTAVDQGSQTVIHTEVFDENNTIRTGAGVDGSLIVGDTNLTINILGLPLGVNLDAVLRPQIEQVLVALEPIINDLALINGVTVGGADTTAFFASCQTARLVG